MDRGMFTQRNARAMKRNELLLTTTLTPTTSVLNESRQTKKSLYCMSSFI